MLLDLTPLREANIDDIEEEELEILIKFFKKTELTEEQKIKVNALKSLLNELVEFMHIVRANPNFISCCSIDSDHINVSITGDPDGSDEWGFIHTNERGYTFEEMVEILTRRIQQISEGSLVDIHDNHIETFIKPNL